LPLLSFPHAKRKSKGKRVQFQTLCSVYDKNNCILSKSPIFEPSMKKAIVILLLLLFLIANSGVAVGLHWCGGKLSSIEFFADGDHNCKCGKRPMKPNCCKDKTVNLKANDELAKTNYFSFKIETSKFFFNIPLVTVNVPSAQFQYSVSDFYHPPLFKTKDPIYLLDRVFLI
jgi:hypothetical protein